MTEKEDLYAVIEKSLKILDIRKDRIYAGMDQKQAIELRLDVSNVINFIGFKIKELKEMDTQ